LETRRTQFRQPHNLTPGLRAILEAELPDARESLRRAGAARLDIVHPLPPSFTDRSPRPIDDRLWAWTARRPTGEWVFADAARIATGEEMTAALVVDAMGRSSNSVRWLAAIGARPPVEEQTDSGFTCYRSGARPRMPGPTREQLVGLAG
jgi:hypothetical protein